MKEDADIKGYGIWPGPWAIVPVPDIPEVDSKK
jgi:hypothetical protein